MFRWLPSCYSRVFYFISPVPKHNIVPTFEPLKPTVAGFIFPFVVVSTFKFSVLLFFYTTSLALRSSRCSSQLELSNEEAGAT